MDIVASRNGWRTLLKNLSFDRPQLDENALNNFQPGFLTKIRSEALFLFFKTFSRSSSVENETEKRNATVIALIMSTNS